MNGNDHDNDFSLLPCVAGGGVCFNSFFIVYYALAHGLLIGFLLPLSVRPLCCRCRLLFLFCLILLYTHIFTGMYEVFIVVVVVVVVSML